MLAQHLGKPLRERRTVTSARELAELVAVSPNDALPAAFHDALDASPTYRQCTQSMPNLGSVPKLHAYRNKFPHYDANGVDAEIKQHGKLPAIGQVLFHGGIWPGQDGTPVIGEDLTLCGFLSTSFCPQVAAIHAGYHGAEGYLWMITIDAGIVTPAFFFSSDRRQKLAHEREVLFARGARVTCTDVRPTAGLTIVEVQIR
jgi:hypothetical protein